MLIVETVEYYKHKLFCLIFEETATPPRTIPRAEQTPAGRRAQIEQEVARERAAAAGRPATTEDKPDTEHRYVDAGLKPEFTSNARHTSRLYGVDPYDLASSPQFQRQQDLYAALSPEDQKKAAEMFGDPRNSGYLNTQIVVNTGDLYPGKNHEIAKAGQRPAGLGAPGSKDGNISPGIWIDRDAANTDYADFVFSHEIAHTNQDFSNYDRSVPYFDQPVEQGADAVAVMKRIRSQLPNGAIDRALTDDEANKALDAVDKRGYSTDELRKNSNLFNYYKNMVADKSTGKNTLPNANNNDAFA